MPVPFAPAVPSRLLVARLGEFQTGTALTVQVWDPALCLVALHKVTYLSRLVPQPSLQGTTLRSDASAPSTAEGTGCPCTWDGRILRHLSC